MKALSYTLTNDVQAWSQQETGSQYSRGASGLRGQGADERSCRSGTVDRKRRTNGSVSFSQPRVFTRSGDMRHPYRWRTKTLGRINGPPVRPCPKVTRRPFFGQRSMKPMLFPKIPCRCAESTAPSKGTPINPWVKVATGSLGQGLAAANGIALANPARRH
jgi:hypothetical protein